MTPLETLLINAIPPPPTWWPDVEPELRAPFPWFGGKGRAASMIWDRFGEVVNYVEPFAGSLAVLLSRPHAPVIETVNDLDGHLVNFWRAVSAHPEAVAAAADWPVMELDLHARHRYLTRQRGKLAARLLADPTYCNPTLAGWWVWGLCAWIGSGWCSGRESAKMPDLGAGGYNEGKGLPGRGVHARGMRRVSDQLPSLNSGTGLGAGKGVHSPAMRIGQPPDIGVRAEAQDGGRGVLRVSTRSRIPEVFTALSARLRYTRVTCGDFERILSPAVTWRHGTTGVLLDPPYPADAGSTGGLYTSAREEREVFDRAFRWSLANGGDKRMRIAFCYYDGTLVDGGAVSSWLAGQGWTVEAWKAKGGYAGQGDGENVNAARERIAFSPGCLTARQASLFS